MLYAVYHALRNTLVTCHTGVCDKYTPPEKKRYATRIYTPPPINIYSVYLK